MEGRVLITYSECNRPATPSPAKRESVSGTTARYTPVPRRALHPGAQPPPNAGGERIKWAKGCPFQFLLATAILGKQNTTKKIPLPKRERSAHRALRTAARLPSFCLHSKSLSWLRWVGLLLKHYRSTWVRVSVSWGAWIRGPHVSDTRGWRCRPALGYIKAQRYAPQEAKGSFGGKSCAEAPQPAVLRSPHAA